MDKSLKKLRLEVNDDVKAAVEEDAGERGRSVYDTIRSILHQHFGLVYAPTERRSNGSYGSNHLTIPVADDLYDAIEAEANRRRDERRTEKPRAIYSKNEVVERILSAHYGLSYVPRPSGRPRRAPA